MKDILLEIELNKLCDRADNDINKLSQFVYEFVYQALSNYSFLNTEGFDDEEEWRNEFVKEIDNILAIINPENSNDIHYLVSLRTIIQGEDFICVSKEISIINKLNYN